MWLHLPVFALALLTLSSAATTNSSPQFEVTGVILTAINQNDDQCPTTVAYSATVTTNGPGRVTYTLLRSDGLTSPHQTLVFAAAGAQTIGWTRFVNGRPGETRTGWQQVQILAPNPMLSNRAVHNVTCSASQERSEPFGRLRNEYYLAPRKYPLNTNLGQPGAATPGEATAPASPVAPSPAFIEPPAEPLSNSCAWYSAGPTNIYGRITSIAINQQNNPRLFATSVGGIWRSTNGGRRWERVSDDFLSTVFASIAVNPINGDEVVAGAGEPNYHDRYKSGSGIWRSNAAGQRGSWRKISDAKLDGEIIYRLRIDPAAPNNIYAATSAGVFLGERTTANTFDWNLLANFGGYTTDLVVDFSVTPRKVYAGVTWQNTGFAPGVWKYDGNSWRQSDSGINTAVSGIISLAISASNPNILYAKVEFSVKNHPQNGSLLGIYKTTTAAEQTAQTAWTRLPQALIVNDCCPPNPRPTDCYSWYNSVIEVSPTDPDVVYTGGMNLYRSPDGGTSWANVSKGADPNFPVTLHVDQHAVAFDPQNSSIVFVGGDGGIYKSGDSSQTVWHWNNISHGMVTTEFYKITSQQASATLLAGGSQDNGIEITFGNRTWYNPQGCDGVDVAVDARNGDTLYANCNWGDWMYQFSNPIPEVLGGGTTIEWQAPAATIVGQPLVTDPARSGAALAVGTTQSATETYRQLVKTVDNFNWLTLDTRLPDDLVTTFIAIAPSSSFHVYYLGLALPKNANSKKPPQVWRTEDGGRNWAKASTGLQADLRPNNCAVDFADPRRAFIAASGDAGGDVYMTTDGGSSWQSLFAVTDGWLRQRPVNDVAIDPSDANVIYITTTDGVFKGTINPGPLASATWTSFDDGLPLDLDVNAIWVNRAAGILTIGTMGHGVYQRNISATASCSEVMLMVRDNVFDNGTVPSPNGMPDPENPILDQRGGDFYKPDDTQAGLVQWWKSPDIRVDVPADNHPANNPTTVDHIEFESCPIGAESCPPGTLRDVRPKPGQTARVHVQVSNRGTRSAGSVRVIALWADGRDAQFPQLPADFWSTTFPATGDCGAVETGSSWQPVDHANPCRTISQITPDFPEVVTFPWKVPAGIPNSSLLVIVESDADPINPQIRQTNERRIYELAPRNRQISVRNVQVLENGVEIAEALQLVNRTATDRRLDIAVSDSGQGEEQPTLLLPNLDEIQSSGVTTVNAKLSPTGKRAARKVHFNARRGFAVAGKDFVVPLMHLESGETKTLGLALAPKAIPANAPPRRISIVIREDGKVVGGITYVIRQ